MKADPAMTVTATNAHRHEEGLLAALSRICGRDVHFDGTPVELNGGFWAEIIRFRLAEPPAGWDGDLVARLMPEQEQRP